MRIPEALILAPYSRSDFWNYRESIPIERHYPSFIQHYLISVGCTWVHTPFRYRSEGSSVSLVVCFLFSVTPVAPAECFHLSGAGFRLKCNYQPFGICRRKKEIGLGRQGPVSCYEINSTCTPTACLSTAEIFSTHPRSEQTDKSLRPQDKYFPPAERKAQSIVLWQWARLYACLQSNLNINPTCDGKPRPHFLPQLFTEETYHSIALLTLIEIRPVLVPRARPDTCHTIFNTTRSCSRFG